jgi:hypothetical protein
MRVIAVIDNQQDHNLILVTRDEPIGETGGDQCCAARERFSTTVFELARTDRLWMGRIPARKSLRGRSPGRSLG